MGPPRLRHALQDHGNALRRQEQSADLDAGAEGRRTHQRAASRTRQGRHLPALLHRRRKERDCPGSDALVEVQGYSGVREGNQAWNEAGADRPTSRRARKGIASDAFTRPRAVSPPIAMGGLTSAPAARTPPAPLPAPRRPFADRTALPRRERAPRPRARLLATVRPSPCRWRRRPPQ